MRPNLRKSSGRHTEFTTGESSTGLRAVHEEETSASTLSCLTLQNESLGEDFIWAFRNLELEFYIEVCTCCSYLNPAAIQASTVRNKEQSVTPEITSLRITLTKRTKKTNCFGIGEE